MKKVLALFFAAGILFTQPVLAQEATEAAATEQVASTDTNAAAADTAAAATEEAAPAVEEEAGFTQMLKEKFIEGDPLWMAPVLLTMILGLAIAIERVLYLTLSNQNNDKLLKGIEDALKSGGKSAARHSRVAELDRRCVIREHLRHAARHFPGRVEVQELVRPVRVRVRAEHARDQELRAREFLAEHAHERDAAAGAHVHRVLAEEGA